MILNSTLFDNFGDQLYNNIIKDDRWSFYLEGLGNTLIMTVFAALIGIVLGCLVAICKVNVVQRRATRIGKLSFGDVVMNILNGICDVYLTVIRGTPMMVQLMVFAFIIFASGSMSSNLYVGFLALGINSGAYVAEIIRAGIMAVDKGQMEAGRSLGLKNSTAMTMIVLPQAIKNILPALGNEAITLLKDTSLVVVIGVADLTYKATQIRSVTYSVVPIIVIAVVYLIVVVALTQLLKVFERRMARNDRR